MKKMMMDVAYGTKEKGNLWELKSAEYKIPETVEEWVEWLGSEKVVLALETLDQIRRQDVARRAHAGGKNTAGLSDQKIRTEVIPGFKLFDRTRIAAERRPPTVAEAEMVLLANADALRAMIAKAKAMGMEL